MLMTKIRTVTGKQVLSLLSVFLLYAFEPIAAKYTSQQELFSVQFWLGLGAVFGVLGLYALLWQQLLKHIPLSTAYMFRGSTLIFVMILSVILLGDSISTFNCIGALMIVAGIACFAQET